MKTFLSMIPEGETFYLPAFKGICPVRKGIVKRTNGYEVDVQIDGEIFKSWSPNTEVFTTLPKEG
jgi:hypothetical protein